MKNFLKKWIIPTGFSEVYTKVTFPKSEILQTNKVGNRNPDIAKYKNIHKGERCFILASGPSVNSQDLTLLENEYSIGVSQFFLHPEIKKIRPNYHCFAPQHTPFDNKTNKIIFDNYINNYDFPVKAFVGTSNYEFSYKNFLQNNPNYDIDAEFIDYNQTISLNEKNHLKEETWDLAEKPFAMRTVIYLAIQLAYYMGFTEIYLLGVDHDYLQDTSRTTDHHFYKDEKSYSDKEHLNAFTTERWFEEYFNRWKQYRLMQEFLNSKNVKIYNATNGGMLDVFPRVKYEELF